MLRYEACSFKCRSPHASKGESVKFYPNMKRTQRPSSTFASFVKPILRINRLARPGTQASRRSPFCKFALCLDLKVVFACELDRLSNQVFADALPLQLIVDLGVRDGYLAVAGAYVRQLCDPFAVFVNKERAILPVFISLNIHAYFIFSRCHNLLPNLVVSYCLNYAN